MLTLPKDYYTLLAAFAPVFSNRVWQHVLVLLTGTILARGERTVAAVLRVMGLSDERHFQNYHRVLNRAVWPSREIGRRLLLLLINTFVPAGVIVMGLDDTIERRRGAKIKAKGIYRDPVRSSQSHFVKASGLRWLSLMLLTPIPWAKRVWALPFLTALCPSERYYEKRVRGHKKLTDWARQMLFQVQRWLPGRQLVVLADASFAALDFLWRVTQTATPICLITRFRLDVALYCPAPAPKAGQRGGVDSACAQRRRGRWVGRRRGCSSGKCRGWEKAPRTRARRRSRVRRPRRASRPTRSRRCSDRSGEA